MLKYQGDCSGQYDHATGAGLVGKIIGPTPKGYLRVVEATYDAELDQTFAKTECLVSPTAALARIEAEGGEA